MHSTVDKEWPLLIQPWRFILLGSVADPDPHLFRTPNPEPHQSKKPRALEAHNGATEAPAAEMEDLKACCCRVELKLKVGYGSTSQWYVESGSASQQKARYKSGSASRIRNTTFWCTGRLVALNFEKLKGYSHKMDILYKGFQMVPLLFKC